MEQDYKRIEWLAGGTNIWRLTTEEVRARCGLLHHWKRRKRIRRSRRRVYDEEEMTGREFNP
jgi:hypothetical protein